jgi:two-component system, NarL family, response regulator DegU
VKKRVLLVDDHRLVREGLRRTLTDAGFDVVGEARDGAEGIELAEQLRPHIVLMDVSMPVLDGITATRRLRSRVPDTRVIVLTMHAEQDLVDKARSAGAAGYLLKDASGDEVVAAVKKALEGHRVISAGLVAASNEPTEEPATPSGQQAPQLTERELQILQMLADGCSPADVAERLFIAPKTVRNHLTKAYDKLGASSRSQAIVTALQYGLIELPG